MALSFVVLLMFFYFNCLIHLILFLSFSDFCSCSYEYLPRDALWRSHCISARYQ